MRGQCGVAIMCLFTACAAPQEEEAAAAAGQAARVEDAGARICAWNIRRLGHLFDHREKDLDGTAKVIDEQCDVVAVQEVMQTTGGGSAGYDALFAKLGARWDGMVADRPRPDTSTPNAEHYAFFYRKGVATHCTGWNAVKYLPDDEDAFLREPAWICLKVQGFSRELLLTAYHAIRGSGPQFPRREVGLLDDDLDLDGKPDDVVRIIKRSRPGDAAVLIVGDLNVKPRDLAAALPTFKDLTVGRGSTLNQHDEITDNLIDHLIVPPGEPLASIPPAEVLDIRRYATGDTCFRSISDHLPIRFRLPTTESVSPSIPDGPYGPGSALPLEDGASPLVDYTIKGNKQSMLYHTAESPYFRMTRAEVWFRNSEDAERAGFTRWRPL
ncbi:MAG: hypothetical protein KF795_00485 [Labilithrix sp.]|nr:hypothetical protein [Labilithrix sp.]